MIINGVGMTQPTEVNIKDFNFNLEMGMNWFQLADGNWRASDRGPEYDHKTVKITTYGTLSQLESITQELRLNQQNTASMSLFEIAEPIFGHNVDYDQPVTAVLNEIDIFNQKTLNGYSLEMTLEAVNLEYKSLAFELPDLCALEYSYYGGRKWSFNTNTSYQNQYIGLGAGNINVNRQNMETGFFQGTFKFFMDDMAKLLEFQRVNRSASFTLPTIEGVPYPFGEDSGSGPYTARLYNIDNIKRLSPILWSARITFVQEN
jgi:hypothetical protein